MPPNIQAAIFFKVLSYDSSISSKQGNEITIFIITDHKTKGQEGNILAGFKVLTGKKIGDKTIKVKSIDAEFAPSVSPANSILYVAASSADETVKKILSVASSKKIATIGGSAELAEKGVAVGLKVGADGKPEIIINLAASKKQGMKLSSRVLGLAKVVK